MIHIFDKEKHIVLLIIIIMMLLNLSNAYAEENQTNETQMDRYASLTDIQDLTNHPEVHLDNTLDFFNEDNYENNTIFFIDEDIENKEIDIFDKSFTFTSLNNNTIYNSQINVAYSGQIFLNNLKIKSDDSSQYNVPLYIESEGNIIENMTFIDSRFNYDDSYNQINIYADNNTVKNCNFIIEYPAMNNNWVKYGDSMKSTVILVNGDYNQILNNTIKTNELNPQQPFGSIVSIGTFGNNNLIDNNKIDMTSTLYAYAITIFYHNNTITNNIINIYSNRYGAGISLNGETSNNTVRNNSVNILVEHDDKNYMGIIEAAYGIVITETAYHGYKYDYVNSKTVNNLIEENTIQGSSAHFWGFEQFGGVGTTINNNHIDIEGRSVMAVASIGFDTTIIGNELIVRGEHNESEPTPDYLTARTNGILLLYNELTTIVDNYIDTLNGPGITIDRSNDIDISKNQLNVEENEVAILSLSNSEDVKVYDNGIKDFINHQIIIENEGQSFDNHEYEDLRNINDSSNVNFTEQINDEEFNDTQIDDNITIDNETIINETIENTTISEPENHTEIVIPPIENNEEIINETDKTNTTIDDNLEFTDNITDSFTVEDETSIENEETIEKITSLDNPLTFGNTEGSNDIKNSKTNGESSSTFHMFEVIQKTKETIDNSWKIKLLLLVGTILLVTYGFIREKKN